MKQKKVWTAVILAIVAGIILTYAVFKSVGLVDVFTFFNHATLGPIAGFVSVSVVLALVLAYKWDLILRTEGIRERFLDLIKYRLVSWAVSYVTPTAKVGGEPFRGYLLSRHGYGMNKCMSTVIIDKAIEVLVHIALFSVGMLTIMNTLRMGFRAKLSMAALTLLLVALTFIAGKALIDEKQKMFRRLFRILNLHRIQRLKKVEISLIEIEERVEKFYKNEKKLFWIIIGWNMFTWVLMYFEYYFALRILGHHGTPVQVFLMLVGIALAYLIPVPMAIGVLELGQVGIAGLLGISASLGLALGLLIRGRDLIWAAVGGLILLWESVREPKKRLKRNKEYQKHT